MKKFGFTIVEVLISLGIIGVVAATVIPSLLSNKNNTQFANGLSNGIAAFESGVSSLMMKDSVTDVFSTTAWKELPDPFTLNTGSTLETINRFTGNVSQTFPLKHMGTVTEFYGNSNIKDLYNETVTVADNIYLSDAQVFVSKNNVAYIITINNSRRDNLARTEEAALEANSNLCARAAYVVIDVNSKDSPNTIGRDMFFFVLGSEGSLYPIGSNDTRGFEGNSNWRGNVIRIPGRPLPQPNLTCEGNNYSQGGIACTARLIENKFEFDY